MSSKENETPNHIFLDTEGNIEYLHHKLTQNYLEKKLNGNPEALVMDNKHGVLCWTDINYEMEEDRKENKFVTDLLLLNFPDLEEYYLNDFHFYGDCIITGPYKDNFSTAVEDLPLDFKLILSSKENIE